MTDAPDVPGTPNLPDIPANPLARLVSQTIATNAKAASEAPQLPYPVQQGPTDDGYQLKRTVSIPLETMKAFDRMAEHYNGRIPKWRILDNALRMYLRDHGFPPADEVRPSEQQ